MRFFQQPLPADQPALISDLAEAASSDRKLLAAYNQVNQFYAKLTNPLDDRTLADMTAVRKAGSGTAPIAVFPGARTKETELFRRLFPLGIPPGANLMKELIRAIRSGNVDLTPRPGTGWYDHQIYALETLLMPEKGIESLKLLLTKAYKQRMLEAFQALITKRRETHARNLKVAVASSAPLPGGSVKPRLRVEPSPSYYLRTARSYDFLLNFLLAEVGEAGLAFLHGLKEGGAREETLLEELRSMRELFYGFHLLSSEDIGMPPQLRADESVDRTACEARANRWLESYAADDDLKVDTRVSVPIYVDSTSGRTRVWSTIGVRLAKLHVSYRRPPRIKPSTGNAEWKFVEQWQLGDADYVIAVDDFAEIEIPGLAPLTRQEFRQACNAYKTKDAIIEALSHRTPDAGK
jgi:hypothetical protein